MTSEKLQRAYKLITDSMDADWQNFRKIHLDTRVARIDPIQHWIEGRDHKECAAYGYNGGKETVLIAQESGYGKRDYFENLYEIVFIPRSFPYSYVENSVEMTRQLQRGYVGTESQEQFRKYAPHLIEVNGIYKRDVLPKVVELAPAVNDLQSIAFDKILYEYGGFSEMVWSNVFGEDTRHNIAMKKLNLESLDDIVKEIEKLPEVLAEYNYWTHIA